MYQEDTIAAIATPPGEGGVAVVRISGGAAEKIAAEIFTRAHGAGGKLRSHMLYHGAINDPQTARVVDEVLLTIMRRPRSYTGEDVVEVHCHGGAFLARRILGVILAQGARQAEPGEFTKRAFLNGKVDLAQAEGVLDLIHAKTSKSAELALTQTGGALSRHIGQLREQLLDISVQVEAAIDFPDEDIELLQRPKLVEKITTLRGQIEEIAASYEWGRLFREGARVCICGRPNVGKSSLLNAILGEARVIVTPIPGTTRDVIEESINLDGLPVVLWDTAGIRESTDEIERLGVELSRRHLDKADAALIVLDGSQELTLGDSVLLESVKEKKHLIALNKQDLPAMVSSESIRNGHGNRDIARVSAKTGAGVDHLKSALRELLLGQQIEPEVVLTNLRHQSELKRCAAALVQAATALENGIAADLVAVNTSEARQALEEIVGAVTDENILERIFANFCIGK
jgi:tRNA modification GTPase